jgi:hypothetical protein
MITAISAHASTNEHLSNTSVSSVKPLLKEKIQGREKGVKRA